MSTIVVTHPAERTEAELIEAGFRRCEVWVKEVASKEIGVHECFKLRVGRFLVGDCWGRGPE